MSAQKNTLFNYFGKSPSAKPSPNASPAPGTPKASKVTGSPLGTPKRALASARAGAQDSPKSTKSVARDHTIAASPRTRVQRRLLDGASTAPNVYEPHFLRNVCSPQSKKLEPYASPFKNKENARTIMLSPVFKALKEDEERSSRSNRSSRKDISSASENNPSCPENETVSPSKCSLRRPVRNLNSEFVKTPCKIVHQEPHEKKIKSLSHGSDNIEVDVFAAFGQYVAAEMRRLESEKSVRLLKEKVLKAILEVQSEQDPEA